METLDKSDKMTNDKFTIKCFRMFNDAIIIWQYIYYYW